MLRSSVLAEQVSRFSTNEIPSTPSEQPTFTLSPPVLSNPLKTLSTTPDANSDAPKAVFGGPEITTAENGEATNTSAMYFSSAVQQNKSEDVNGSPSQTLSESASEYESKLKNDPVTTMCQDVVTGEEGESNVLQISCKLHVFDSTGLGLWKDLGRTVLRLNDGQPTESPEENVANSRLVVRNADSMRVALNTSISEGMTATRVSVKTIRISALDAGSMKVFLISASPGDTGKLYDALNARVAEVNKSVAEEQPEPASSPAPTSPKVEDEAAPKVEDEAAPKVEAAPSPQSKDDESSTSHIPDEESKEESTKSPSPAPPEAKRLRTDDPDEVQEDSKSEEPPTENMDEVTDKTVDEHPRPPSPDPETAMDDTKTTDEPMADPDN